MKQILSKSVVFIGLMGTGKTVVGDELSKKLGVLFSDSDKKIEQFTGKSIVQIFHDSGESYFRDLEEEIFCDLFKKRPHIISSGGGAILSARARQFIFDRSYSIWLKSDVENIINRINKKDQRPLLSAGNPIDILNQKLIEREMFYNMADFHLENADMSIETISIQIIEKLVKEKVLIYGR